jgi:hypothetical protein
LKKNWLAAESGDFFVNPRIPPTTMPATFNHVPITL